MKNTFTDPLFVNNWFTKHHIKALIMRVSQVSILIMTSAVLTMGGPKGNGQSIESTTVDVGFKNESLKEVFREIERQTDFLFSWDEAIEKSFGKVSLEEGRYTVREVLDLVLGRTELEYRQSRNYVIVLPVEENGLYEKDAKEIDKARLSSVAQVTGTVKDANTQEPLVGVNIIVKGTTRGTTTDVDGKFEIESNENDVLVFTYIGFKTFETIVSGRSVVDVSMVADVTALKEVEVNAGYWGVKDKERTGNISRVTSQEIRKQPVSNPLESLQGRVPGLFITQGTGVPGGGFTVQIRGRNNLRSNASDPLFIVDGVPYSSSSNVSNLTAGSIISGSNPLNYLNPTDIESIEILKDADATAIYGSRGANGVILITTKKGQSGKTKVDMNVYAGIGRITRKLKLLNTQQYLDMRNEAFKNDNVIPTVANARDLLVWDTTRYTDWQEELIGGTANVTSSQVSISGGTSNTQFLVGLGYYKQTTVFPGDFGDSKKSGHFNLSHQTANKRFNFNLSASFVSDNNNLLREDLTFLSSQLAPNAPRIYDENGGLNWENSTWENPLAMLRRKYESTSNNFISRLTTGFKIFEGLEIKNSIGYLNLNTKEQLIMPISSYNPSTIGTTGITYIANSPNSTWIVEPQIQYRTKIANGALQILIGSTFQENIRERFSLTGVGYANDALLENINAAPEIDINSDSYIQYLYNALFARLNYNWKDKYLINLTGRRDGSSRFGPNKRFANFGAIGMAWLFSNEDFVKNALSFLTTGKIRASYGRTGSDQIEDYGYMDTYAPSNYTYENGSGLLPTRLSNPDYSWEINNKMEASLDIGFINDRLIFSGSFYRNQSSNQLVGYSLPAITGFSSIQFNLPATVENSGWEFEFHTVNLESQLVWSTSFNLTIPKNELIEFPGLETSAYVNTYKVGESLSIRKKLRYLAVDPQTGVYNFEDVNGNGVGTDNPADLQFNKEVAQKYYGGFLNNFQFKGFELDILFQFVKQTGNTYLSSFINPPGTAFNQPDIVMRRWQESGDVTDVQMFTRGGGHSSWKSVFS